MSLLNSLVLLAGALSILISGVMIGVNHHNTKRTIDKLSEMIDSAINGHFTETIYDESTLSALEAKLNRYLCGCVLSSKNLSSEKEKIKSLISDISHQTKTPISNLILYTTLLSEQKLPMACMEMLLQIQLQSEKLNFLIGALIKTSRLETGIITVRPTKNYVKVLFDDILPQIAPKAAEKDIQISVQVADQIALFDRKWTGEAIYNILDNAVKYTQYGGKIEVNTLSYELFCRIDIKDNGIGINEDEQNKIFGRFYRLQEVQEMEGVGIGLYLAREILTEQSGYIKVKSSKGAGSLFSVFLPMPT